MLQVDSGAMQEMMNNPQAMEAMLQVQQGMAQLQHNAPNMFSSMSG